jgi:glycosyltransferase involved in cell wall biosynthesis
MNPVAEFNSLNIWHISPSHPEFVVGGAEKQSWLQAVGLTKHGHRVLHISSAPIRKIRRVRVSDVDCIHTPFYHYSKIGSLFLIAKIFSLLFKERPDVLHVHIMGRISDIVSVCGHLLQIPIYVKLASGGMNGEMSRVKNRIWNPGFFTLRFASALQAISSEIEGEVEKVDKAASKIVRIPNGVHIAEIDATRRKNLRDSVRARYRVDQEAFVCVYIGRLAKYKGIEDLIGSWESLGKKNADKLLLVGPIATDEPIHLNAEELMNSGIQLCGSHKDITPFLFAADVLVHPSMSEGMSNTILEAAANGIPIISTNVGATVDLFIDGESARIVPVSDAKSLSAAITELRESPKLRNDLAIKAFERIQSFSIENVVKQIEEEYFRLKA